MKSVYAAAATVFLMLAPSAMAQDKDSKDEAPKDAISTIEIKPLPSLDRLLEHRSIGADCDEANLEGLRVTCDKPHYDKKRKAVSKWFSDNVDLKLRRTIVALTERLPEKTTQF